MIPIFVRDLSGRTLSLRVSSQITCGDLSTTVSGVTGVPPDFFYLTIGGRVLGCQDLFGNSGASSGIHVQMNGRLRGGARPPAVLFRVSGRAVCVEWRVVGRPGPDVTGAMRPDLVHLPARLLRLVHRGKTPILANPLLPSLFL